MSDQTYNGWTNYETWCCKLWMGNDEGSYLYWKERAEESSDAHDLAQELESHFDDMATEWMPDQASFFTDIMGAALASVNWYEIAESLLEDVSDAAA